LVFTIGFGLLFRFDSFATNGNLYEQIQRLMEVVQAVNKFYFESVDSKQLVDGAITGLLAELDPHSVYIPAEQMVEVKEQSEGEFEGIGVEFIVYESLPLIISAMPGSPAEAIGLRSGDRITKIDGVPTLRMTNEEVREKMLGRQDTKVTLEIQRYGFQTPFLVAMTRKRVPIQSVTSAFIIAKEVGYIRVGRFAKSTDDEFEQALKQLEDKGMKRLILDLRGNAGGYLEQAVRMADQFLKGRKRIVYTRGRTPGADGDYYSSEKGRYTSQPLIVLIDHGSASAAEIVAGAIQDWDRGLILGTTSFGKGLVQHQIPFKDGSAVRVTIARYFTPSGRLIQRPYEDGLKEYFEQGYDDIDPNVESDTLNTKPVYITSAGRKVYGGGGITPDIRILSPLLSSWTLSLIQNQVLLDCASRFASSNKNLESDFDSFVNEFTLPEMIFAQVRLKAGQRNVTIQNWEDEKDVEFVRRRLKSQIARHFWGTEGYNYLEVVQEPIVRQALNYFEDAENIAKLAIE